MTTHHASHITHELFPVLSGVFRPPVEKRQTKKKSTIMLQIEFEFYLPCGYIDEQGNMHRQGMMRRANALDEIEPLSDPRVRANDAYLSILLLSRVITRLGTLTQISPAVVARLFATDFIYLQDLYVRVNAAAPSTIETQCPTCGTCFALEPEPAL
jgi:hypothetical protein